MPVAIRLKRFGAKNKPYFRVVAVDERNKRDGEVLEYLGTYDPQKSEDNFKLSMEKIDVWLGKGALISETVRSMYRKSKKAEGKNA